MRCAVLAVVFLLAFGCGERAVPPTDTTVTVEPAPFDYAKFYDADPTNRDLQDGDEVYGGTRGDGSQLYWVRAAGDRSVIPPGMRLVRIVRK